MNNKSINIRFFILSILALNYLIPILFFGNVTLFYHDALEAEIVYNHVIGKYLEGNKEAFSLFLNEQIQIEYLRRVFQPFIFLYVIFETETAYWVTDILVKIISYLSFYVLAKNICKEKYYCCLVGVLYASINLPTHIGLGFAIVPYLIYLINFKNVLRFRNYLIIIFAGINTDIVTIIYSIPVLFILSIILNDSLNIKIFKRYLLVILIFFASILVSNLNLLSIYFGNYEIHRLEFTKDYYSLTQFIISFFKNLFYIPTSFNWGFFYSLPILIFLPLLYLSFIFLKDKKTKFIFSLILTIIFLIEIINVEIFGQIKSNLLGSLNFDYFKKILPFIFCISILIILSNKKFILRKALIAAVSLSIFISQINSSIIPFYKKFILNEPNYRNIYTFKEYYLHDDYKKLKKIIQNEKTISVGIDPMIAIINDIATIDGYHNIYPLSYKKKFRKIIEKELEKNLVLQKYYDNWGSRVYAFQSDPNEILINFEEAKNLGAKYVISTQDLGVDGLKLVCSKCSKYVKLFYIE